MDDHQIAALARIADEADDEVAAGIVVIQAALGGVLGERAGKRGAVVENAAPAVAGPGTVVEVEQALAGIVDDGVGAAVPVDAVGVVALAAAQGVVAGLPSAWPVI